MQSVCFDLFIFIVDETIATNVAAGIMSGTISSAIANPTDVLKVRSGVIEVCVENPIAFCSCGNCLLQMFTLKMEVIVAALGAWHGHAWCMQ